MSGERTIKMGGERKVTWKRADGSDVPGFEYGDPSSAHAIIVVQEWWGVDQETKNKAEALAARGYRCLIPDLYRGTVTLEEAEAMHLMENLDWAGAVEDVRGGAKHLMATGSAKVGITGFCMGGALALAGAVLVDEIAAAAPFYGTADPSLCDTRTCKTPVQGHFGDLDDTEGFSSPVEVAKLREDLAAAGCENEVFSYPGVGHAFMNTSEEPNTQAQQKLAWDRLLGFFGKHLRGENLAETGAVSLATKSTRPVQASKPKEPFEARFFKPLPQSTNAQEAATRVYSQGNILKRTDPFIEAVDRHGRAFPQCEWRTWDVSTVLPLLETGLNRGK